MINRIYKTVKTLVNVDLMGNYSPEDFEFILHNVVLEKFEELFFEVTRLVNRQNRGLINGGFENLTEKVREKIEHYLVQPTAIANVLNVFTLPSDLRYFDDVMYKDVTIEMLKNQQEFNAVKTTNPDVEYPIGLKQGNKITVLPTTIQEYVTVSYIRNPKFAKWTYNVIGGIEVFNPSANDYQDVDVHSSEETDVILRVLLQFGVNLKEKDIQAIVQKEKQLDFNQENIS